MSFQLYFNEYSADKYHFNIPDYFMYYIKYVIKILKMVFVRTHVHYHFRFVCASI